METEARPVIQVQDLVKTYRMGKMEVPALQGVSLSVHQGEIVALMGPSGSGKSTLMNIIGLLDRPTSGSYRLDGVEVSRLSDNQQAELRNRRVGFIFQTYNLLGRATALANVELPLIYSGRRDRRRAEEALARVGLSHRARHKPLELSGGEQQRVGIARALVSRPAIILADEPTGNLDSRTSQEIMDLLKQLNAEEGLTLLVITHERDIALQTQRILYLRDGVISGEEKLHSS